MLAPSCMALGAAMVGLAEGHCLIDQVQQVGGCHTYMNDNNGKIMAIWSLLLPEFPPLQLFIRHADAGDAAKLLLEAHVTKHASINRAHEYAVSVQRWSACLAWGQAVQ